MSTYLERPKQSPILVTGAHRTGTTWVGKTIAVSKEVSYISEPLNVWHRPGVLRAPVKHWYTYICDDNEAEYLPAFRESLRFRYHTWLEILALRSIKDFFRMVRDWCRFTQGSLYRARPLFKDPFAIFSAPWFFNRLGCQVIITIRHPAAFVSSLKRLEWDFNFHNLFQQPLLMRDHVGHFRQEMEKVQAKSSDSIEKASLLWRLIYHVVNEYREKFPEFKFVRHEDLSLQPLYFYNEIFGFLELGFTPRIQKAVLSSAREGNPQEVSDRNIYAVRLDSRANLFNWKRRLKEDEINRIRDLTEDVAESFYSNEDWG